LVASIARNERILSAAPDTVDDRRPPKAKESHAIDARPVPTLAPQAMTARSAPPALRDRFLGALDADDRALSTELALGLTTCSNPLPGMTCDKLGLPMGSTYGSAAQRVLLLYAPAK
jgi:hypothetical protein